VASSREQSEVLLLSFLGLGLQHDVGAEVLHAGRGSAEAVTLPLQGDSLRPWQVMSSVTFTDGGSMSIVVAVVKLTRRWAFPRGRYTSVGQSFWFSLGLLNVLAEEEVDAVAEPRRSAVLSISSSSDGIAEGAIVDYSDHVIQKGTRCE
jgi:hypothetical protein